jgi:hypothetical protein
LLIDLEAPHEAMMLLDAMAEVNTTLMMREQLPCDGLWTTVHRSLASKIPIETLKLN